MLALLESAGLFDGFFTPRNVLLLSAMLFCVGLYGVLSRRNLLVILMSLEVMLVAVNVVLVLFSRMHGAEVENTYAGFLDAHTGQFFALMTMTVAAGEVGVGLAIVVALYRANRSLDVDDAAELRN
ncbi:MAG: NADH-quinone oxidoreductase subunit NuoK [Planctomycetes bacterium]|nr:NADH-quinone oxidoreductase subunit NuoK [Planctomycetota bacterium]